MEAPAIPAEKGNGADRGRVALVEQSLEDVTGGQVVEAVPRQEVVVALDEAMYILPEGIQPHGHCSQA